MTTRFIAIPAWNTMAHVNNETPITSEEQQTMMTLMQELDNRATATYTLNMDGTITRDEQVGSLESH